MKTFKQLREEVWDQPSPNKTSKSMTPQQKAEAKRRAKAAGRPYPNLVDNMAAMKEESCCGECLDEIVESTFYSDGTEQYEDWGEPSEEVMLEISPAMHQAYRKAAGAQASALDKQAAQHFAAGNVKAGKAATQKANKRFSGIVKSTIKEEDNAKVKLNKPFLTPDGPKKRAVYVKNDKGNVVKVSFGDKNLEIKRDDPERRKAYRARHGCDNPGPKWRANYWSCKFWGSTPVSEL